MRRPLSKSDAKGRNFNPFPFSPDSLSFPPWHGPHRYVAGVDEAVRGLDAVQLRGGLVLNRHLQGGRARGVK